MLNDEILDKVILRLTNRIEQGNEYILEEIGKSIKKIGTLTPTKAHQLAQILKYGGDYDKITKKLAEITKLNVQDIKKIFEEVAKSDYQFSKQFYEYRNQKFIPYEKNMILKTQVDALANITANEYANFSKTLAFTTSANGKTIVTPLAQMYREVIDQAVLSIAQGKETYESQLRSTLKELATSGIKTIDYESGRSMRLDSAVRMHMRGALRNLHNEEQEILGEEFKADGVEISVHLNPAPDHAEVQGKQFSKEEFYKFQNDIDCHSYDNVFFSAEYNGHDRRAISQYNCYHYIFPIILGVSKPEYTNEQLKQIREDNLKGFEFEGKHYTNYEGTQLQRQIETEIRKQKDIQIIGKASGDKDLVGEAQKNITILTNKYKALNKASGLPTRADRLRVSGYKRTSLTNIKPSNYDFSELRTFINDSKDLIQLQKDFNYNKFYEEYNKFYNSLDKNEIKEVMDKYEKFSNVDNKIISQPIGEFLNKKLGYDALPELIDEKEFWVEYDGTPVSFYHDTTSLDKDHIFRGIGGEHTAEEIQSYVKEFKQGKYFAGTGIYANGTHFTTDLTEAWEYAKDVNHEIIEDGIIYSVYKPDAKVINLANISNIKREIVRKLAKTDDLYYKFSFALLQDNGYLASLLGYDILEYERMAILLNRGAIKVVR